MSLRNKLAILSITLMSLLTIPARAENDTTPASSRIENAEFFVDVTPPEGWAVTDEFKEIPAKVEFCGSTFHTLKFSSGTPSHGCVVLFSSDSDDEFNEDVSFPEMLSKAYELAFPGSVPTSFTPYKFNIAASTKSDAKISFGGSVEGIAQTESGSNRFSATAGGNFEADLDSKFAITTGKVTFDNISGFGGAGLVLEDDYNLIIAVWGADEETLKNELIAFSKALKVTAKEVPATTEATKMATQETEATLVITQEAAIDPVNPTTEVQG